MNVSFSRRSLRQSPRPADRAGLAEKARRSADLDFFYGDSRALKSISCRSTRTRSPPSSVRPAAANRLCCACSTACMTSIRTSAPPAKCMFDGENILIAETGFEFAARAHRHGVSEADAVPDVDLREHRLRHQAIRTPAEVASWTAASKRAAARGAVGRGQGQAQRQRPEPVRRPAAAPLHRPHRCRAARR